MAVDVLRAIVRGNREQLDKLIQEGHDILAVTELDKWNYLHKALKSLKRKTPIEMVNYLIDYGIDVNAVDRYGNTPLYYAVSQKHTDITKVLLSKGANQTINNVNNDGISSLRASMLHKSLDYELIRLLLEYGANPDQEISNRITDREFVLSVVERTKDEVLKGLFE